jgi:hypothetical protein
MKFCRDLHSAQNSAYEEFSATCPFGSGVGIRGIPTNRVSTVSSHGRWSDRMKHRLNSLAHPDAVELETAYEVTCLNIVTGIVSVMVTTLFDQHIPNSSRKPRTENRCDVNALGGSDA